jgi:hypothetical protein
LLLFFPYFPAAGARLATIHDSCAAAAKTFRLPRADSCSSFFTPQFLGDHLSTLSLFSAAKTKKTKAAPDHGMAFVFFVFSSHSA